MTSEIALVLSILGISLVLFISEKIRMDVVALMVLGALALTGLVTPTQALSGFSNAAVVTVWAMFILSDGLTRTGIANIIGRSVLRMAGRGEARIIIVIMLTAGVLSGFMNNIGVAALMLPVTVDIARRTDHPPGRLLMPLAYGSLLGGLTTLIGTPPNLLVSGALDDANLEPFKLFDFTPIGGLILVVGVAFVALLGRHVLPMVDPAKEAAPRSQRNLRSQYGLSERTFMMRIPEDSALVGKTMAESRLGTAVGLIVIAMLRRGRTEALPSRNTVLRAGDVLLVQGRLDRFNNLRKWSELVIEREAPVLQTLLSEQIEMMELAIAPDSALVGEPLQHSEFRERYGANVLAIRRGDLVRRIRLSSVPLRAGDRLLVQCSSETVGYLEKSDQFDATEEVSEEELKDIYRLQERVFVVRVPKESGLSGETMAESRLGDAFDFRLLGLFREGELEMMPEPQEVVQGGDLLLIQGRPEHVDVLRGLQELDIQYNASPYLSMYESDRLSMLEATLDPHSSLAGRSVGELNFREKYGLQLIAIWRNGKPYRSDLEKMQIQLGDALLLVGPRQKLAILSRDPDFIVLTPLAYEAIDARKAPLGALLMLGVIVPVLLGWLPISIAAVVGATLMVLTRCLTMEEAYRAIEWRSIFLIAGMLPLGIAMEQTGAAEYVANGVMSALLDFGPWAVLAGLYLITAIATMIIPTAALVVLMAPIVLSASAVMGTSPYTGMMAVAMAASASFTSPISHPANVLVMGPGGYRFVDYLKLGVPLTFLVFLVVVVFLPMFWPLYD